MRWILIAASAVPLAACTTVAENVGEPAPAPPVRSALAPNVVLALSWEDPPHRLRRLDARTLRPTGPALELDDAYAASAVSPNGRRVALGSNWRGRIEIVDLRRMRRVRTIDVGGFEAVTRLAWTSADRLLALLDGPLRAVAIDPRSGTHELVRRMPGYAYASEAGPDGLAMLLAPSDRIGDARVAVFDDEGVRSVALPGFAAGSEMARDTTDGEAPVSVAVPAFAVEPGGARAVVVAPDDRIAEIDLRSQAVQVHEPDSSASLLGRVRDWLEPEAEAKLLEGWDRRAVWLASGLVVVAGADYSMDGGQRPAGATVIDPRDWSVRKLDPRASEVQRAGDGFALVRWDDVRTVATVYDGAGQRRYRLGRRTSDLHWMGRYLYAGTRNGARYEVVDTETGETLRRRTLEEPSWLFRPDG